MSEQAGRQRAIIGMGVGVLVLVGLLAMVNTLAASLHGRRREHAALRAAGLSVRRLFRMVMAENLLLTVAALVSGLMAGVSFLYLTVGALAGWSLAFPLPLLLGAVGVSLGTALLVSVVAARAAARTPVLAALRQE